MWILVYFFTYLPTYLPTYLFASLSACPPISLSLCLSTYPIYPPARVSALPVPSGHPSLCPTRPIIPSAHASALQTHPTALQPGIPSTTVQRVMSCTLKAGGGGAAARAVDWGKARERGQKREFSGADEKEGREGGREGRKCGSGCIPEGGSAAQHGAWMTEGGVGPMGETELVLCDCYWLSLRALSDVHYPTTTLHLSPGHSTYIQTCVEVSELGLRGPVLPCLYVCMCV